IWSVAIDKFQERPILGYGFTFGADSFVDSAVMNSFTRNGTRAYADLLDHPTMHNGYVQALLDSGIVGLTAYCTIIIGAVIQLWRNDVEKRHPAFMYVLVFSMIGNMGETYIFGVAQSHQVMYWLCAIFALGLTRRVTQRKRIVSSARARPV